MNRASGTVFRSTVRALTFSTGLLAGCALAGDIKTGLIPNQPIDAKLFPNTRDYFEGSVPRKIYRVYRNNESPAAWSDNQIPPEECVSFAPGAYSCVLYVPADYDGTRPFGVYLHISPGNRGHTPSQEWRKLMDAMSLIYVSAHETANATPMWRRVALSVDSVATVRKHYNVDGERIVVGGLSGGGHMAFVSQMLYPEVFQGAVSHAAQSFLPKGRGHVGHFPGLQPSDVRSGLRRDRKWVVISGNRDRNYNAIKETSVDWARARMAYRFIDVPGMAHENASAGALEEALTWILGSPAAVVPAAPAPIAATVVAPAAVAADAAGHGDAVEGLTGVRRTWTSARGTTIEAEFVRMNGHSVVLRPDDGHLRTVPLSALSAADQALLRAAMPGP